MGFFETLVRKISELSCIGDNEDFSILMQNWKKTSEEWYMTMNFEDCVDYCVCGHDIRYNFHIQNIYTDEYAIVGSRCIEHFKNESLIDVMYDKLKMLKKISKLKSNNFNKRDSPYTVDVSYIRPKGEIYHIYKFINNDEAKKIYDILEENEIKICGQMWEYNDVYYLRYLHPDKKKISFYTDEKLILKVRSNSIYKIIEDNITDKKMEAFLKTHTDESKLIDYLGKQPIKFGKYKGKTYSELYDEDKPYCAFVLKKFDRPRNRNLFNYLEERINEDAKEFVNSCPASLPSNAS
jgi:hypothetical protein